MKTYKEMEKFLARSRALDEKLANLEAEKLKAQQELASVSQEYESIIIAEAVGDTNAKVTELPKLQRKVDDLQLKVRELDDRISAIQAKRQEALSENFEDLKRGYRRESDKLEKLVREMYAELPKMTAQYLIYLSDIGKLMREARDLYEDFYRAAQLAGQQAPERFTFYQEPLFEPMSNRHIGALEKDQRAAISGSLPMWVQLYQLTGEIDVNGGAHSKLAQAQRGAK